MSNAAGIDLLAESDDQAALRQLARDVATREVAPRAHQGDEDGAVPAEVRKALSSTTIFEAVNGVWTLAHKEIADDPKKMAV